MELCELRRSRTSIKSGRAEAKLNWSGRVRECVRKHAAATGGLKDPQGKFFKFDALRSLLRAGAFLDPSSALPVALGSAGWISDSIWYVHVRGIYCLVPTSRIFLH